MKNSNKKAILTKDIKATVAYYLDMLNELKTQYPQRDGSQYYLGEIIMRSRLNTVAAEVNEMVAEYNSLGGKQKDLKVEMLTAQQYMILKRVRDRV